jgi:ribosome-binding protein aMBF1 (putative translation factor)
MARPRKAVDTSTYTGRFAVRVRSLREKAGMSVEELSEVSGIPLQTLHKWESADRCPVNEQILLLAEALHVKVARLVEDK